MNVREQKYFDQGVLEGRDMRGVAGSVTPLYVRGVAEVLEIPENEAARRLIEDYQQRLDAVPSHTKYPELSGMRACILAYNGGLAQSSGASEAEITIIKNYLSFLTRHLRPNSAGRLATPSQDEPGCTLVFFPHSDRGPLFGNNTDDPYRPGCQTEPVWPVANHAGLILGTVSSGIIGDEVSPELFPAPIFLMVYEMCSTADEAVELLTRLNLFWGPFNLLVADSEGNSAVIEKSSCRYGLRKSTNGFSATTAMAAQEPHYKEYLWQARERSLQERGLTHDSADWAYWKAAESRSRRLLQMLEDASVNPTYAAMENILYHHTGEPDQICLDGGKCHRDEAVTNWTVRVVIHAVNEHSARYSFCEPPQGAHLTPRHVKHFPPMQYVF